MSEQDKRPLYMGTFERHKKELQVKHEALLSDIQHIRKHVKKLYIGGIILYILTAYIAFAM